MCSVVESLLETRMLPTYAFACSCLSIMICAVFWGGILGASRGDTPTYKFFLQDTTAACAGTKLAPSLDQVMNSIPSPDPSKAIYIYILYIYIYQYISYIYIPCDPENPKPS